MKILLFGADGQLGRQLRRALGALGDVTALARGAAPWCGDVTNAAGIEFLAGGDHADILLGNANTNFFIGGRGDDIIRGGGGTDTVFELANADPAFADADYTLVSTSATTATLRTAG